MKNFGGFFREIAELVENGFFDSMNITKQKKANALIDSYLRDYVRRSFKRATSLTTTDLNRAYIWYKEKGFTKNNKGLRGWRLVKTKPLLREELKRRIHFSLSLISTHNEQTASRLRARFLDWIENRGQDGKKQPLRETLKAGDLFQKRDKHMKMVLGDQTRKLIGNFDNIVAQEYQAIGFFWKTRRDRKVVGNPAGKYPGQGNPKHGDHYVRQDKFYFFHSTWAIKKGLVNTKHKNFRWADFEDGMPGQPINCRCYAYNIYELDDIPEELLTEKGEAYIKENSPV